MLNKKEEIISFPRLGDYEIPISYLLRKLTKHKIMVAPPITKNTIELGSKYSPDFACVPFKYNLGNFIEALDNGATILMQAGGGCRYGYYAEIQEQILKDLGYHFEFITLTSTDKVTVSYAYKIFKHLNPSLNFFKFAHYFLMTFLMIIYMDKIDHYIRGNIGFEIQTGSFENLKKKMHKSFSKTNHFVTLTYQYFKYKKAFRELPLKSKENSLKIGIIGELYTSMEPFSSYFLEKQLAKMNIEVKRFTNLTYLLLVKSRKTKKMLREVSKYCTYTLGADGLDNVYRAKYLIEHNFDGIVHIKPFGCTPEIGAIPIINKVCQDERMPIIYFSFDNQTSLEGIKTRLEAFYDMLVMKKEKKDD